MKSIVPVNPADSTPVDALSPREKNLRRLLFGVWALAVVVGTIRHEYWRDEVRALSLVRHARSLAELLGFMKDEGHPMLWHLLLYAGYAPTSSKLVLPLMSLAVAGAAVALLVFRCPLPIWLKALFVLGRVAIYEYSVVARNYGISMLLLYTFASLYAKRRRHPLAMGVILACLANTNLHSIILAGLLMAFWFWDELICGQTLPASRPACRLYVAAAILAIGIVSALLTLWPSSQMVSSDTTQYTALNAIRSLWSTLRDPANQFRGIAPRVPAVAVLVNVIFIGSTLGLLGRPAACAVVWVAIFALSALFEIVYPGSYRHQGLLVVFLFTIYWMVFDAGDGSPRSRCLASMAWAGLHVALPSLLLFSVVKGAYALAMDVAHDQSASRPLGTFLKTHPEHAHAILVGEPDFYLESLPYYADNSIYIVRERRFGDTVSFTRRSAPHLELRDLLHEAWTLHVRENREVLIALGHQKELDFLASHAGQPQSVHYAFGRTFSWSGEDLQSWGTSTALLARFVEGIVGDERYSLYKLVAPPP